MRFTGDYDKHNCAMELSNVTIEDEGQWKCELEEYKLGISRGSEATDSLSAFLEVNKMIDDEGSGDEVYVVPDSHSGDMPVTQSTSIMKLTTQRPIEDTNTDGNTTQIKTRIATLSKENDTSKIHNTSETESIHLEGNGGQSNY